HPRRTHRGRRARRRAAARRGGRGDLMPVAGTAPAPSVAPAPTSTPGPLVPLPDDLLAPAPHPADLAPGAAAGEVAVVTREGVVESRHLGHGVLVDPDGAVVAEVGDPSTTLFPRS